MTRYYTVIFPVDTPNIIHCWLQGVLPRMAHQLIKFASWLFTCLIGRRVYLSMMKASFWQMIHRWCGAEVVYSVQIRDPIFSSAKRRCPSIWKSIDCLFYIRQLQAMLAFLLPHWPSTISGGRRYSFHPVCFMRNSQFILPSILQFWYKLHMTSYRPADLMCTSKLSVFIGCIEAPCTPSGMYQISIDRGHISV